MEEVHLSEANFCQTAIASPCHLPFWTCFHFWHLRLQLHVPAILTVVCADRINTLRTGDANLRFYITTAQDG